MTQFHSLARTMIKEVIIAGEMEHKNKPCKQIPPLRNVKSEISLV